MAGRRTNLALVFTLGLAFATGVVAFAIGTGWDRWVVVAHGIAGVTIVLLAPWKSVIARRGLKRKRRGTRASLAFSLLVVAALVFGFLHSTGIVTSVGGLSAMQIHVGAALVAAPLAIWHVVARRVRMRRADLSRRQVLKAMGMLAGAGASYAAIEGTARLVSLEGAERRFTGSHELGSFDPEAMPVTQWLDDRVQDIDARSWRLATSGRSRREWTLQDLDGFDDRIRAVIDCTGGWYAEQEWAGVWLSRLLEVSPDARSIVVRSITGYRRRYPVSDLGDLLLATRIGGRSLSPGHGFPARLVAPGRRGFWWVKWVASIEESARPWWVQLPFPAG